MTESHRIQVTIDRLVLHGVDRADAAAVERQLRRSLGKLLAGADPNALHGLSDRARVRLEIPPTSNRDQLGASAARAVSGALGIHTGVGGS